MSERNELTERDRELLQKIEEILAHGRGEEREADSLYGFCAHLASTLPRADDAFRGQLASRLVAKLEERQATKTMNAVKHKPGWMVRLFPGELRWRTALAGAVVAVALAVALLAIFPGFRAAAAQAVGEIRQILGGGISSAGPNEPVTFRPAPPFNVKQPGYLPEGFERTISTYQPGRDPQTGRFRPRIQMKRVFPESPSAGREARQAVERDRGSEPHIVLVYEASDGRYVQLFERAAQPGEALPAGEPRTVAGQTARLQRSGQVLKLIWIDEGTRIELEGTLSEAELLRIAEGLVITQTPSGVTERVSPDATVVSVMGPDPSRPYCNPEHRVPPGLLLGRVNGQQRKGSVTIYIMDPELYPIPETLSYGASVKNVRDEVLAPALAALQDSAVPMQRLRYPSLSFKFSEAKGCFEPDPKEQGYVVIEVWDGQVNIGYGGAGAVLKERAIRALAKELQMWR